ncbi:MAG: hypothetical protein JNM69_29785 [Archangium sp.]|nr:hypothetical protein [Archangium sp.]
MAKAAAKKTPKKRGAEVLPSRALEHGANAFGARYLKPGFALTPELDLAFALGHGSAMGPVRLLSDLAPGAKQPNSFTEIHRNVAIAWLRMTNPVIGAPVVHEENPAPIDEAEAQKLLRSQLPRLRLLPIHFASLEAMAGPSCMLPAYVDGLSAIADQWWDSGRLAGLFPLLYGLLLRTPPNESNAARAKLEALLEKKKKAFASAQLDILLHGREGIARHGYKYSLKFKSYQRNDSGDPSNVGDLCYCDDDSEFVASQFQALWAAFNHKPQARMMGPSPARLFFLGGEKTLETELKVVGLYAGTVQAEALASYAELRSPLAAKCVKQLAGEKSKVKAAATEWLQQHA